ncbi:hypothetical protein AB0B25_07605 [Nocardia sp. NPDC049190]|uniref:hypothetical protein n=1 Tax=Nocardia sp. NPDC049190 TaxID=3155650 RepID=UPI0033DBD954
MGVSALAEYTPTLVVLYDVGSSEPRRVAEFRLTSGGAAALTVLDPRGCLVAERWHNRGLKVYDPPSRIRSDDGPRFLRELIRSAGMSYYRVVDESAGKSATRVGRTPWQRRPDQSSGGPLAPPAP